MRKYQKAAVVMAMLGSVSFLGAGVSHADDGGYGGNNKFKFDNKQHNECSADESRIGAGLLEAPVALPAVGGTLVDDHSDKNWNNCTNVFGIGK